MLEDLGRSLGGCRGFGDVLVSNFHGSPRHFVAIETACDRVSRKRGIRMVSVFSVMVSRLTGGGADLSDALATVPGVRREDLAGDVHAGLVETAQLLALHPDWVDRNYSQLPQRTVDAWLAEQGEQPPRVGRGKPGRRAPRT